MLTIHSFTFGPFQENTFVLHNGEECLIIDPGCYTEAENNKLRDFIQQHDLKPVHLLNTHCHVDHVAGNAFVFDTWGLRPLIHKEDLVILQSQERVSAMYGLNCYPSPMPNQFIEEGALIKLGDDQLEVIFTPGHAPGHVVFYCKEQGFVINGDVLFNGSIGRTDLPYGDFDTLEQSIKTKMYTLPEETVVHCGHGPSTSIGKEKFTNPFVSLN